MNAMDLFESALAAERQAVECYESLRGYFEAHNLAVAAAASRNLGARHEKSIETLHEAGLDRAPATPWLAAEERDFVMRVATPHSLVEMAIAMERDDERLYETLVDACGEDDRAQLARRLASVSADNARRLRDVRETLPASLDWEGLIAAGTVPALALGAERRLRRH